MLRLLDEVLQRLGYEPAHALNGSNASFTSFILKKNTYTPICTIHIDNAILYSDTFLELHLQRRLSILLSNGIWFKDGSTVTVESLKQFIQDSYPADAPEDKMLRLLKFIRSKTKYDGQKLYYSLSEFFNEEVATELYMYNTDELDFYLTALVDAGLVFYTKTKQDFSDLHITTKGINKLIAESESSNSKDCFVAMSFDDTLRDVYDKGIVPAVKTCGFEPIRIDDDNNIPNELTINDAILAGIKKSKFVISDFTEHKKGVYFEAGYALGRGLKVIYTCREDQINHAHFDTRNYPHIVWRDVDDLRKKLVDKIEIFIKA